MEIALKMSPSSVCSLPKNCPSTDHQVSRFFSTKANHGCRPNAFVSRSSSSSCKHTSALTCTIGDVQRRSSLESLFCYDKSIREELIEKPIGLALAEKKFGDHPRCPSCLAKGANLCTTCAGSGLYVDSILESQGIIVKVKCLGCGGTGNTMCSECGGRGHI